MTTRHYFRIAYVEATNRREIELVKIEGWNTPDRDWASRREFDWYELDADERNNPDYHELTQAERDEIEIKAGEYARELADKHGLTVRAYSKIDGILD